MKKILFFATFFLVSSLSTAQSWTGLDIPNPILNQHDNQLYTVCADKAGKVYTAGMVFDSAWHIIVGKWNGTSWSSLATGDPLLDSFGQITSIITDTLDNIFIVGQFGPSGSLNNVVKWNGVSWSKVGALNANSEIVAICFDKHYNLYAAGEFTDSSGHCYVAKWDGTSWTEVGTGVHALNVNSDIKCLYADSLDNVYAAGGFTDSATFTGGNLYVARWDGTSWSELGGGVHHQDGSFNTQIWSVVGDHAGNIYASGEFIYDSGYNYVAKWDGTSWSKLGAGAYSLNANGSIHSLCADQAGNLYAAGYFTDDSSVFDGNLYVAKWDGTSWSHLGAGFPMPQSSNEGIYSLCLDAQGNIYAAGTFTDTTITFTDPSLSYHPVYVAKYTFSPSRVTTTEIGSIHVYPNPAHSAFNIVADKAAFVGTGYALYDETGKIIMTGKLTEVNTSVNMSDLSTGLYILRMDTNGQVYKIIKE
jgi:hypothetical protein